ncbi:MAG: hypothetical protein HQL30_03490 [Candidatus Omnitrophica bacterium]|nr:hypothetical protein [Candidatus Omnitrophota bacterium]
MNRNYKAFVRTVKSDHPYEMDDYMDGGEFKSTFKGVHQCLLEQHSRIKDRYFSQSGKGLLDLKHFDHYLIICLRVANALFRAGTRLDIAEAIYYSSRARTSVDIYYRSDIGDYFIPCHPIGTVIDSHSKYGIGLNLYNNVHIGPYDIVGKDPADYIHPVFGDGVVIMANVTIYGDCKIGNNVIVSHGTTIINQDIPDNCLVMGKSPDLKLLPNFHNNLSVLNI